jgi:hypothetical protein
MGVPDAAIDSCEALVFAASDTSGTGGAASGTRGVAAEVVATSGAGRSAGWSTRRPAATRANAAKAIA